MCGRGNDLELNSGVEPWRAGSMNSQGDEALLPLETFWRNGRWYLLVPLIAKPATLN